MVSSGLWQAAWARAQQYALLAALRPDAVALVDAFGIEDYLLNSAIGRADGDVYRALLAAARASPLNATQACPGHVKTILKYKAQ